MTKDELYKSFAADFSAVVDAIYRDLIKAAVLAEREACATEAECIEAYYDDSRGIAAAIRARKTP